MENLADAFLRLDRKEIALLKAIERGMRHSEWVLIEDVMAKARLSPKAASSGLSKLVDKKLVFGTTEPYEGYQIGFAAYDLIALSDLVDRDVVVSLGDLLGVGKESVVFEALGRTPAAPCPAEGEAGRAMEVDEVAVHEEESDDRDGSEFKKGKRTKLKGDADEDLVPLAVKFHRQGRTSFKHVRRARDHLRDQPRCAWIHAARLGGAKEFKILKRLHPDVSVPRPVALSHHAVVMEHTGGTELHKLDLENPEDCFEIILEEVAAIWERGIVHADLSAYNVLVRDDGEIVIIDWPQAVSRTDPRAIELLERDLKNVVDHFHRKYRLNIQAEEPLAFVLGEGKAGEKGGRGTAREVEPGDEGEIDREIEPDGEREIEPERCPERGSS